MNENQNLFYFSVNYAALVQERRPWWEQVFYHGSYDRDDKLVSWVIQHYVPNDGKPRYPLKACRNTWSIPAVAKTGIEFAVSEKIRDQFRDIGSKCEFLEVTFEYLYEVPWGDGIASPLPDDASDARIAKLTRSQKYASEQRPGRFFELVAPIQEHCLPRAGGPSISIAGELTLTRTVELEKQVRIEMDPKCLSDFQVVYHGGAGLICTSQAANILRESCDPRWFAFDPLFIV